MFSAVWHVIHNPHVCISVLACEQVKMSKRKADDQNGSPVKKSNSLENFTQHMDGLIKDIVDDLPKGLPSETYSYIKKMCDYTCAGGKMTRGITVGATYEAVLKSTIEELSSGEYFCHRRSALGILQLYEHQTMM